MWVLDRVSGCVPLTGRRIGSGRVPAGAVVVTGWHLTKVLFFASPAVYFRRMKKIAFLTLLLTATLTALAQSRSYKVDGYILSGADTVTGTISIPVGKNSVDYASLSTQVIFIERSGKIRGHNPRTLAGFGLRGDDVLGDYVSVTTSDLVPRKLFLKKLVDGAVVLLEENADHLMRNKGNGTYLVDHYRTYYLKNGVGPLVAVPLDPRTSAIRKKDLKKLLPGLPDSFTHSEEAVTISELIPILEEYNAGGKD